MISCMKRLVALLRGINISGKNKVPMSELKEGFIELGFTLSYVSCRICSISLATYSSVTF